PLAEVVERAVREGMAVRRVPPRIRAGEMGNGETERRPRCGDPVDLLHEPNPLGNVLDHVVPDDLVQGGSREGPGRLVEVVHHVRTDGRTPIDVGRPLDPLAPAAEVQDPPSSPDGVGLLDGSHAFARGGSGRSPRYTARHRRTTAGQPKWSIIL